MVDKINLAQKFTLFDDQWTPRIVGELNDLHIKVAKIEGAFIWHKHDDSDELFLVTQGTLLMHLRDKTVEVNPGEIIVIPAGVEHKPEALSECQIVMFERKGTLNTGDAVDNERTKTELEWI
ncbi:cupin domain-containing protein [Phototrophicus methaneseepsis]|uniref:Cupin domain-containing protein n=1 Tax=Phototrophicus methaneseepsis TaxID=2710758 RepID=A0A7S8EC83_9CHLR|nr:cupin domain-containing protein [Phototrophicus methaneseepsis]QPC84305.1 cupin domain-containing protein [Phototrophicus methaneseepsis]